MHLEEGLLDRVAGLLRVAEHPQGETICTRLVALHQDPECGRIAGLRSLHGSAVIGSLCPGVADRLDPLGYPAPR
jgi:hypothetical protein